VTDAEPRASEPDASGPAASGPAASRPRASGPDGSEPGGYLAEHVRTALAADPRAGELGVTVRIAGSRAFLCGDVSTPERRDAVAAVASELLAGYELHNDVTVTPVDGAPGRPAGAVRVAAVGDLHVGTDSAGRLRPHFERVGDEADLLLLAGDLTRVGDPEEAAVLVGELRGATVPVVAVLGNHDYHCGRERAVAGLLEDAGVRVLEGEAVVVGTPSGPVGVAGTKGFGGGFAGACGSDFGEPLMKAFVGHTREAAERLEEALAGLDAPVRIALLHYAPTDTTLHGERLEIYPFLGSYLLGEAVDRGGADVALHGHAHGGTEHGLTDGGTPVRNVAQPVLRRPYAVYCFTAAGEAGCNDGSALAVAR
jgi:Icc-related predicted phosphoesterase